MTQKTCHSGGAEGADLYFEQMALKYCCKIIHYSYRTVHHHSKYKYELSEEEFLEGKEQVSVVSEQLHRYYYKPYLKYLARNYFQVKNSQQIFAVSELEKNTTGEYNRVKGGTGWAVQMGINKGVEVNVYDQKQMQWYRWNYETKRFEIVEHPIITAADFAGIGTRKLNVFGLRAIEELFEKSFEAH